jgi:hypothetical protein
MAELFPHAYKDAPEQKAFIAEVVKSADVSVERYKNFKIDQSRNTAFVNHPYYNMRIKPLAMMTHWTANTAYTNVDHFTASMQSNPNNRLSVAYYMDRDEMASTFHLIEDNTRKTAHALGANDFTQGIEIKAEGLYDYTPQQIENTIYVNVKFCRDNNYPINRATVTGHFGMDLITTNPYYNPATGTFSPVNGLPPKVRKFDPPQDLIDAMIVRAQALDAELGPR